MEWILLAVTIGCMLLCIPIAGKIEEFFLSEEHFMKERYGEYEEAYQEVKTEEKPEVKTEEKPEVKQKEKQEGTRNHE